MSAFVPPCQDCVHFWSVYDKPQSLLCGVDNPPPGAPGSRTFWQCAVMRAPDGRCGPEGTLFVAKET